MKNKRLNYYNKKLRFYPILFSSFFFILISQCIAQISVLKNYDFDKYYLFYLQRTKYPESDGFYINDVSTLKLLQKKWVVKKEAPDHIGYSAMARDFIFYICKQKNYKEIFSINSYYQGIYLNDGEGSSLNIYPGKFNVYLLEEGQLNELKQFSKKAFKENKQFATLIDARNYYNKIRNHSQLLYLQKEDWVDFEGTFYFKYKRSRTKAGDDDLLLKLEQEIRQKYNNEKFKLEIYSNGFEELEIRVLCNKSLSDKFKLYPIVTSSYIHKWNPYSLNLLSYWKDQTH